MDASHIGSCELVFMIMCKSGSLDILHCETIQVVTKSYLSASPDECVVHASSHAWVPDTHCSPDEFVGYPFMDGFLVLDISLCGQLPATRLPVKVCDPECGLSWYGFLPVEWAE